MSNTDEEGPALKFHTLPKKQLEEMKNTVEHYWNEVDKRCVAIAQAIAKIQSLAKVVFKIAKGFGMTTQEWVELQFYVNQEVEKRTKV